MTAKFLGLAATLAFAVTTSQTMAQESTNNVANTTDWSVFVDGTPKECWGVSKPKETVNTKDGAPVSVRRGEIRSEEHTSELQSHHELVCRILLEKKKSSDGGHSYTSMSHTMQTC